MPLTITPPPVQPPTVSVPLTLGPTLVATASVVPPSVIPPAITIADATMVAALQADGYTVTAAVNTTGTNTSTPVTPPPPPPIAGTLAAIAEVFITQGGPNYTDKNTQTLSWAAVPGATGYQVYRNGAPLAVVTSTTYADTAATNSNDPTWASACTPYTYDVAPMVNGAVAGPLATQVSSYMYHNGVRYNSQDFSYGSVKTNYQSTDGNPQGGQYDISVFFNNGGFQPVFSPPQCPIDDFEAGGFNYFEFDMNPGNSAAGLEAFRMGFLSRLPPGDVGPYNGVNTYNSGYGPTPVNNTWAHYRIPLKDLGIGTAQITASIQGTTLTVTAAKGVAVDAGGFVYGPGVPAGTYIMGFGQQGSVGTFTVAGPNINANTNVPSTPMTFQRTAVYKYNNTINGLSPTLYFNNIGFKVK